MNLIKERRLACGLTQEQLAEKVGVSRTAVRNWEKGRSQPEEARSSVLAAALECDVASIRTLAKKCGRPRREHSAAELAIEAENRERAMPYISRRKALGLTQKELARRTGIHPRTISCMESGKNYPCWETRQKIRRVLGMPEERFCSEEERNAIFLELEAQDIIRLAIQGNYRPLRAVHADLDDLYQELAICALRAIDRYRPEERAALKTFVERNMDFFIKRWIVKVVMHGLSGKVHYPLPDVRVVSLNELMENGFDPGEEIEGFAYTGEYHRKRPHTHTTDQSVCV